MKYLNKSKVVLHVSLKNSVLLQHGGLNKINYRQFTLISNREWIDLEAVCKTGKIPKTFNFARDVFEKHVVSCYQRFFRLNSLSSDNKYSPA